MPIITRDRAWISVGGGASPMDGNVFKMPPGVVYALDKHDKLYLRATTDLRLVSVFNPPTKGDERHSLKPGESSHY